MKVVITGGGGFLGGRLADAVRRLGQLTGPSGTAEPVDEITLLDVGFPAATPAGEAGAAAGDAAGCAVSRVAGDATDPALLREVVDRDDVAVFHLASMVSAGCEADFDAALRVNLDSTRAVLQAARARRSRPRVVFTSSIAAFGGPPARQPVGDDTKLTPQTTYGVTKAIGELLVNDYTRKGFLDGRTARLPTVVVRPGRPNAAASSWVSGIFREPLAGAEAAVPVDPDLPVPVSGYRTVVANLVRLHEVPAGRLRADRAVNLPAIAGTARQMERALRAVAGDRPLGPITYRPDPAIAAIFADWPTATSFDQASELGLLVDTSLEPVVQAYLEDYGGAG